MLKKLSSFLQYDDQQKINSKLSERFGSASNSKANFDFLYLIQSWKDIAGEKLSEHTIPLKNQNGTLIILSNHSAFASEMKFMEVPLKRKIFEKFPELEKQVKTIHFIVDTTHFTKQVQNFAHILDKTKNPQIKIPHPYSPEYKKAQKEALEEFTIIEDEEMKKQFISIYIQNKFKNSN